MKFRNLGVLFLRVLFVCFLEPGFPGQCSGASAIDSGPARSAVQCEDTKCGAAGTLLC